MAKDTKERILAAALEQFSRRGYAGTNIRELTASLGLGKSSMYRHFESKEAIWDALLDGMIAYYAEHFGSPERLPPVPGSAEELAELTMRMVRFTVGDGKIVMTRKLLQIEQFRDGRARSLATKHFLTGLTEMFTPLFAGMMDRGVLRRDDPAMLAFAYTAPIAALIHLCDREPEKIPWALERAEAFSRHFAGVYGAVRREEGGSGLRLRPYKPCDAPAIVSWIGDERAFRQWCADRFDAYPITAEDLNRHYAAMDGSDSFFGMTAFDGEGPAGHLILRFTDPARTVVRFGFVIVDARRRGMGLGREMLGLALRYAFDILRCEKATIGVFENNEPAYRCYRAAGFRDCGAGEAEVYRILGEEWKCRELEQTRGERKAGDGRTGGEEACCSACRP